MRQKLCEPFDGLPKETVDKLEAIADEFTIGFAEFLEIYQGGTPNKKVLKQLLEIYKKQIR